MSTSLSLGKNRWVIRSVPLLPASDRPEIRNRILRKKAHGRESGIWEGRIL